MKGFRTAAVAGVIALGVSAIVATPAQAHGRPVLQQLPMPASGLCADVDAPTTLNLSGVASGGWTRTWAQWTNGGQGGNVCSRTLVRNNSTGRYQVQS
jgi:hypothetical protein